MRKAGSTIVSEAGSWRTAALFVTLLLAAGCTRSESALPVATLTLGTQSITAEIAATPASRERGLMQRPGLPENHGMLFVFPGSSRPCMWMKDTYIPLSVAFIDLGGRIINIADMRPQSREIHCAQGDARYTLEMTAGWYKLNGVSQGVLIGGLEKVALPPE
jgi:uncharacterized membrane protein (UPF0127 family)